MLSTLYKKSVLGINQIWFPDTFHIEELIKKEKRGDILFIHGVPAGESQNKRYLYQEFQSYLTDLTAETEEIWKGIGKNVRYEIRRSERETGEIRFHDAGEMNERMELLKLFSALYEQMYREKGMEESMNLKAVRSYLAEGKMLFSAVWFREKPLVFHSYIWDGQEVSLLHSASCFRGNSLDGAMLGRVNKRLHWEDMLYLKERGVRCYDWGGISDLKNPNGIDAFKLKLPDLVRRREHFKK